MLQCCEVDEVFNDYGNKRLADGVIKKMIPPFNQLKSTSTFYPLTLIKFLLFYRVTYRSMDRSLTNEEVNLLQDKVRAQLVTDLKVELR